MSPAGLVFGLPRRWYPTKGPARGLIRQGLGQEGGCAVSSSLAGNSGEAGFWGGGIPEGGERGRFGKGQCEKAGPSSFFLNCARKTPKTHGRCRAGGP